MNPIYKKYPHLLLFLLTTLFISACKKDKPETDVVPEISFVIIAPSTVTEYQDSVVIKLSYKDGDGDLGENNADVKNMFVTDNRIGITYPFRIQQLAPLGSAISIEGELNAVLNNLAITDNSASQPVTFTIYVIDRAGHISNSITTSEVTIVK